MKKFWWIGFVALAAFGCCRNEACKEEQALKYPNILDINYTPETIRGGAGWFTDQGAWDGVYAPDGREIYEWILRSFRFG